jgi:hypothetical protein
MRPQKTVEMVSISYSKPMVRGLKPHYRLTALNVPVSAVLGTIQSETVVVSSNGGNIAAGLTLVATSPLNLLIGVCK